MPAAKKVWLKAEVWVTKAMLEVAQSAFVEAQAIGIEVDDGILPEGQKKYDDDRILVKAYFESTHDDWSNIHDIVTVFFVECGFPLPQIDFAPFHEQDWQGNFVKTCTTFMVDPDIYIVPSFEIEGFLQKPRGPLYIEMDPENAFGTGQHQTTKLCLTALRGLLAHYANLGTLDCLDVGAGSGILAILIKKLGAKSVLATETDEDALHTAERNAMKNGVHLDTLVVTESHCYDKFRYDVVVANILAPVLIGMAENLASALKARGQLILSGILLSQVPSVIEAYEACGLRFLRQDAMDDWCALLFERRI